MKNNAFTRTCVACRAKQHKSQMIRVSKGENGLGRGAYVCKSEECIKKCVAKRLLNKSFKCEAGEALYKELSSKLGERL